MSIVQRLFGSCCKNIFVANIDDCPLCHSDHENIEIKPKNETDKQCVYNFSFFCPEKREIAEVVYGQIILNSDLEKAC